jgi:hypothetical protein
VSISHGKRVLLFDASQLLENCIVTLHILLEISMKRRHLYFETLSELQREEHSAKD